MGAVRDASLIIIATEGKETEKQYFDGVFQSSKIRVLVLPTIDGDSAPSHVLKRLVQFKKDYQLNGTDQLWLVVDVDRWPVKNLKAVAQSSDQKKFRMAVSNPCFEIWLYLHLSDEVNESWRSKDVEVALRTKLGSYNKSKIQASDFASHLADAIKRASKLDQKETARWPSKTGTHVYRLVKEIRRLGKLSRPANP